MNSGFGPSMLFTVIWPLLWLVVTVGLAVAIVLVVRALRGIDRSLRTIVEQGVARGEGPFDAPTAP